MSSEPPTEPSIRALRAPSEFELASGLTRWLADNPIPQVLHAMVEGVVLGLSEEEVASALGVPTGRLPAWRRCFARWAGKTVDQAAGEVWRIAHDERCGAREEE